MQRISSANRGFTLVELMITIAILTILAAIAIPAYNGYITESRLGAARVNADSLRIFLEDFQLENGTYKAGGLTSFNKSQLQTNFNWQPDGDNGQYSYTVTATTTSYDVVVEHTASGVWIRCQNRMATCCDSTGSGSKTSCTP